jgi:excisionase family DNA binding protein
MMNLLNPVEVAELLNVSVGTLAVWRCTKRYPLSYVKVGRSVRYRIEDVESFVNARSKLAGQPGQGECK